MGRSSAVVTGLTLAVLLGMGLLVGCEEEVIESFPDMAPPAAGKGGIRGHMHGAMTEAVLCSEAWDIQLGEISCRGSRSTASIDPTKNDLFSLDELEPGEYWLVGRNDSPAPLTPEWYMIGEHGHKVTVHEGQWTDVVTFEGEESPNVEAMRDVCLSSPALAMLEVPEGMEEEFCDCAAQALAAKLGSENDVSETALLGALTECMDRIGD